MGSHEESVPGEESSHTMLWSCLVQFTCNELDSSVKFFVLGTKERRDSEQCTLGDFYLQLHWSARCVRNESHPNESGRQ